MRRTCAHVALTLTPLLVTTATAEPADATQPPAPSESADTETPVRRKLAVMDLNADTEIPKGTLKTLNEILLNEFSKSPQLDVLGSSDIASMLTLEEERIKVTGCVDDSCLAEIGGALGVELVGDSRLGAVGDNYVVNVKVLDVVEAKVLGRATELTSKDAGDLVAAVQRAVAVVVAKVEGREPPPPPAPAPTPPAAQLTSAPPEETSPGFLDYGPWIFLGLTAAAGITGAVLGGLAYSDDQAAADEYAGTPDWRDTKDEMETKALAADVMFAVAGAAAATTVVLFVLGALDDEPAAVTATLTPMQGGCFAGVSARFE